MNLEEAPEEPHLHSEPSLLSPASPKPIHFPAPTNIPVLNNMMDVSFNQTELHMQDPSMRNTELREGAWKEADVPEGDTGDMVNVEDTQAVDSAQEQPVVAAAVAANISMPHDSHDSSSLATSARLNVQDEVAQRTPAVAATSDVTTTSSDVAVNDTPLHAPTTSPSFANGSSTPTAFSLQSGVDVQALLASLQAAPKPATSNSHAVLAAAQYDGASSPPPAEGEHEAQPTTLSANEQIENTQSPAPQASTSAVAQPGFDLVSALTRGITPSTKNNTADLAVKVIGSAPTPSTQAAADGATQPRVPSSQRERKIAAGEPVTEDDVPWTTDIQQKYDAFIQEERKYVNDGKWDQFPQDSRLFIGNLSSESVTKRDIFHVFHTYGPLAQISIKQAFGFVQFLNAEDCARALVAEEGTTIRNKRIHLEISKPQKSRNNQRNRSRSPGDRNSARSGHDRGQSGRYDRDFGRGQRSPSPRGGYRDRYDDRHRERPRSPHDYGHSRDARSPSPRRRDYLDEDLPLPRRAPQDIPDVQIIVRHTLGRAFIEWVENGLVSRGLRVAVLVLNPRLSEDAVIRRQLLEGVLAIVRIDRNSELQGRVNLRVFTHSRGTQNVSFLDYDNVDMVACAELVVRAKGSTAQRPPVMVTLAPPAQPQYGYAPAAPTTYALVPQPPQLAYAPQYGVPQQQQQAVRQQSPGYPSHPGHPGHPVHLQTLLSTARTGPQQQQQQQGQALPQTSTAPYGYPQQTVYANPQHAQQQQQTSFAPAGQPVQSRSGGPVNMQDILARLGTYNA